MKKYIYLMIVPFLAGICCLSGCQDEYFFDGGTSDGALNTSTYDFLVSRPRPFDTLLWVVDRNNLKDQLNQANSTFFVPQDGSIKLFLGQLELDPFPKSLEDLPVSVVDTLGLLLKKYMITEKIMRADIPEVGNQEFTNANSELVNVFFQNNPRGGIPGFGPKILSYSVPVKVINPFTGIEEEQTRFGIISTSDLESTNGAVHVMAAGHIFGF
ncbi:hypothetical protein QQ020_16480 [Fulvivirgaceae bacterium BMA12]|uniref:FAS1 domain-containing protein n=1 Tax=Agaribacillus aureus TaxID=3051825 RepID=A0ABT8L7D4_9BACT|nr:hypothetical protein [Fulvivirgaceae bacterium BMA12]